jgi:CheY-like chemotaxis protein
VPPRGYGNPGRKIPLSGDGFRQVRRTTIPALSSTSRAFGFGRLFRRWTGSSDPDSAEGNHLFDDPDRVNLLAITRGVEEEQSLRRIADRLQWTVSIAPSLEDAVRMLREQPMTLVICDRDLPGGDWRKAVAAIAARRDVLCVVLASTVVDGYLWDEVIKQRGYDVVSKPFEADQLQRAVRFAGSWKRWSMRSLRPISIG